ncbi:unnamed protein product, partial [Arabidopsis halleri]
VGQGSEYTSSIKDIGQGTLEVGDSRVTDRIALRPGRTESGVISDCVPQRLNLIS